MNLELKVIPPVQLIISASLMVILANYLPQYHFDLPISLPMIILLILLANAIGIARKSVV